MVDFHVSDALMNMDDQQRWKLSLATTISLLRAFEFTVEKEGNAIVQGTTRLNDCFLKATRISKK